MKPAWREADRAAEVREAAAALRDAGFLDDAAHAALAAAHPVPRPLLGDAWRALVFFCVVVGAATAVVLAFITTEVREPRPAAVLMLLCGAVLAAATDLIVDRCGFRPTGAEAATSLVGVFCIAAAGFLFGDALGLRDARQMRLGLAWSAPVLALASWRWGFRLYAAAAATAVLFLAAHLPAPRLAWALVALLLLAAATATLRRPGLAPLHRQGLELVRLAALAGLYAAVSYFSVEQGLLEEIARSSGARDHRPGNTALLVAAILTGALPPALLAWGVRTRDRLLVDFGAAASLLSLATLRFYVPFAPAWALLAVCGAALGAASLALERWLRAGDGGERGGFTGAPLAGGRRREPLLPAAAALAVAPAAQVVPTESRGQDAPGGGGGFGGGGATGTY